MAIVSVLAAAGMVVATATSASASAGDCDSKNFLDSVCLYVNGSGTRVDSTNTSYSRPPGAQICNYKAWNSGADSANSAWSKSTSIYYQCRSGYASVTMSINRTVYDPSFYYAQFYANGAWVPAYPRVLVTS
jgi:hypothetical protein